MLEKRNDFRVFLNPPLIGKALPIVINGKNIHALEKYIELKILDLSAGGMRFETLLDLSPTPMITFKLIFSIEGEEFDFLGNIAWKKRRGSLNEYGVCFIETLDKNEERLVRRLNEYQIKRLKFKDRQQQLIKQIGTDPKIAKIIEVLPYPAYLITKQYMIVAANEAANLFGTTTLGHRCSTICEENSYCKLNEAVTSDEIISGEMIIRGQKFSAHWLYLGNELFCHYFKETSLLS